jgi:sulfate transport system permease protein
MELLLKKNSPLPGFKLTLWGTTFYLIIIVIWPLSSLFINTASASFSEILHILGHKRVVSAYKLSFCTAFVAAIANCFIGTIIAWVMARYNFVGKSLLDILIDIPLVLPTAIAGITLASMYGPDGIIGKHLAKFGINIALSPLGISIALMFVSLPFVVRTIEPVLHEFDHSLEEVAATLGASKIQVFYQVILPHIFPAILTGFVLAFARSLGEYGSVIFITGNIPGISEIVPLLIAMKLEQFDYMGANVIALLMLLLSFGLLLLINILNKNKVLIG